MSFVLDSSVTLSWYFADQRTHATAALLDRVIESGAVAPTLWRLEVAHGLQTALRRGLSLASLDQELRAAGDALGIALLGT